MKSMFRGAIVSALLCFGLAGIAAADTVSAGGVSYTFTSAGTSAGGFLVSLVVDTTKATASGVLLSFSVQFAGASDVTISSKPSNLPPGSNNWVVEGRGPNTGQGCNINGDATHWCVDGGAITVTAGEPGDKFTFVFDVKVGTAPAESGIQAFQGNEDLNISTPVGIGGVTPPVPEPATMLLIGLGLAGMPLLRGIRRA
jgi:hypothetical protein